MDFFLDFLQSEEHFYYVTSSYLIVFFLLSLIFIHTIQKIRKLEKKLNDKIERNAGKVHSMGYIEFQIEVIKSLWSKDESKWPMNEVWITSSHDGVSRKIPIE